MWFFKSRKQREEDLDRELRSHLDLEAEEQREAGLTEEDAGYAARRAFGNQSIAKEDVRSAWGGAFFDSVAQDLRYAFRSLRASPVFTLVAVASLGLGIGANTAIFSFVNALLLKQLPVPEPERLVNLSEYENGKMINSVFSYPMIKNLDARNRAFDGIFGRTTVRVALLSGDVTEPLHGELVTGGYFKTLKIKPALGRLLSDDDVETAAGDPVCVISYALWQTHFGGDPGILGRKLILDAHPYVVVGVTQKGFYGSELQARMDLQIPLSRAGDFERGPFISMWKSAGFSWLEPLARLKPGVSSRQAQAMIEPLGQSLRVELANPKDRGKVKKTAFRLSDGSQGVNVDDTYFRPVTILMGVVGLVLLIACANVANLLLARAGARATEFAVRLSLGASRVRLVRQLMLESLVLGCSGGVLGIALAFWMIRTLLLYLNSGDTSSRGIQAALNPLEIAFAIAVSLITAVLFGLTPAWQSTKPETVPDLKRTSGHRESARIRRVLIVSEIALSMIVLFAAGLLTRTLSHLRTIDLGFDPSRVVSVDLDPGANGYSEQLAERAFDDVIANLRTQPGVASASIAVVMPLGGGMISFDFDVPGRTPKSTDVQTNFNMIGPDYFKTLNQRMLTGREFNDRDVMKAPHVAIVNQLFVQQYMPGESPLGRHIKFGGDTVELVGLVKDSAYQYLRETKCPLIYLPVKQTQSSGFALLVRTYLPLKQARAVVTRAVRTVDPKLPINNIQEMQDVVDHGMTSERVMSFLATLFSALVTVLCAMGLYGLIAYAVARRTREIGVRFAIGAQKRDVAKIFFRESLILIAAGIVIGVPLALASARILKNLLFGVEATNVTVLIITVLIFLGAGILASVLPVRKATKIEPMQALRYE